MRTWFAVVIMLGLSLGLVPTVQAGGLMRHAL
jgi:hypothetical protein